MKTVWLLAALAAVPAAAQRVYPSPEMQRETQRETQRKQDRRANPAVVAPMRVDGRTGDVRLPNRVWTLAPSAFGDIWVPVDLRSGNVDLDNMVIWPYSMGMGAPPRARRDQDAPAIDDEPEPAKKKAEQPQTGWRKYVKKQ
jgi:hypothetical protein